MAPRCPLWFVSTHRYCSISSDSDEPRSLHTIGSSRRYLSRGLIVCYEGNMRRCELAQLRGACSASSSAACQEKTLYFLFFDHFLFLSYSLVSSKFLICYSFSLTLFSLPVQCFLVFTFFRVLHPSDFYTLIYFVYFFSTSSFTFPILTELPNLLSGPFPPILFLNFVFCFELDPTFFLLPFIFQFLYFPVVLRSVPCPFSTFCFCISLHYFLALALFEFISL